MAEAVLYGIAQEIIKKLGSQVIQEIGHWWGFKDELEKLNRTVSTIKAVLLHAEEQSRESIQVKDWLGMLKDAIYDADDLLDEVSADVLRQQVMTGNSMVKEVRRFFPNSNWLAYGLEMSHKIKAIRSKLDEIADNRRFHLEERSGERVVKANGRETYSSPPDVVIPREEDKEKTIPLKLSSNYEENVSAVPIVRTGGLGKTTLHFEETVEWLFLFTSLLLECSSALFEQLNLAMMGMVMAIAGLLVVMVELIFKARKEQVRWEKYGWFLWRWSQRPHKKPFGTIVEYFGLAAAIWQCFHSFMGYFYALQNMKNPITMTIIMFLFSLYLLISKLLKKYSRVSQGDKYP